MRSKSEDQYYTRGRYRLHYRVTSAGENTPTVLLLHGWAGNYTVFEPLVALLNARGYSTIVPDLRGHGLSDKHRTLHDYEFSEFVEDVHVLLEQLGFGPQHPSSVLGYSAGGTIALLHELKYPGYFKELLLIGANHRNPIHYWGLGWLTWVVTPILRGLARVLRFDRRKRYKHIDLVKIKSYWGSVFEGLQSMPVDVNVRLITTYATLNLGRELGRIKTPALILRGKGDPFFTDREARELANKLGQAKVVTVEGAGHYLVSHHGKLLMDVLAREGALPDNAR